MSDFSHDLKITGIYILAMITVILLMLPMLVCDSCKEGSTYHTVARILYVSSMIIQFIIICFDYKNQRSFGDSVYEVFFAPVIFIFMFYLKLFKYKWSK